MDKKGTFSIGSGFAWAVIIGIIILIMLFTGGAKTLANIASFMAKLPAWIWVIIGVILLFKMVGKRR